MNPRRWFPHFVTLAIAVVLIVTQQAWASPLGERLAAVTATSKTTVNYQGFLTDSSGSPVEGAMDFVFRLYNVESGGSALWTETQAGVPVSEGLFSVLLGSVQPLAQSLFEQNATLWLGIAVGADQEMTPREQLSSAPFALSGSVPAGVIVMWSGPLAAIPQGWALCNGTNGTPNLSDRFILGVNAGENPGVTGGSHTVTLSVANIPVHSHAFTTDLGGAHSHFMRLEDENDFEDGNNQGGVDNIGVNGMSTTTDGTHSHSGATNSVGSGAAFSIRPAYYKLAFIIKQ